MKRMFLDNEKAQKLSNLKKKKADTGRQMKSGSILGHPPNSFFTHSRQFQNSPIQQVNHSVGNTGIYQQPCPACKVFVYDLLSCVFHNISHEAIIH